MTSRDRQDDEPNDLSPGGERQAGDPDQSISSPVSSSYERSGQQYGLKLTIESGESQLFTTLPIRIGRAENNDLVLPDETVSSHHAQIYYDEIVDDICIVDLGSLNGLLVDDHPTHRNVLYDGTKIGLGAATLLYRDTGFIYTGNADSGSTA